MRLKDASVSVFGFRPELVFAILVVDGIFREMGKELVITSGSERTVKHKSGSCHYNGCAFDCRTRDLLLKETTFVAEQCRLRLGAEFDVVQETDHLHIEYQPKG